MAEHDSIPAREKPLQMGIYNGLQTDLGLSGWPIAGFFRWFHKRFLVKKSDPNLSFLGSLGILESYEIREVIGWG
jgi:hypothetical protein